MLKDRVSVATATTGTGTVTLGAAVSGYRTFASAYPADAKVSYVIVDGAAWETGTGTFSVSANTVTRTLIASSTGALLSLSGAATISVAMLSADYEAALRPTLVMATRTTGDVTVSFGNAGTLYNFDTNLDLVIPAVAGDVVEVSINTQAGDGQANSIEWNFCTMVGGAGVNYYSNGTISSWSIRAGDYFGLSASVKYVVKAADLSGGSVRLRLLARTDGGNSSISRKVFANANQTFSWDALNLGTPF